MIAVDRKERLDESGSLATDPGKIDLKQSARMCVHGSGSY
jgi:hypothetical protein